MGRDLKRVPLDFQWPMDKTWEGYLMRTSLHEQTCAGCQGSGYSPEARRFQALWYGHQPCTPEQTGSTPLTAETPDVRAFAERNIASSPHYYGTGEAAVVAEAQRLADLWNGMWSHHLNQDDVNALVEAERLMDFTHTWTSGSGWAAKEPSPAVSAEDVNRWSRSGFGHDSINSAVVIRARCEREGVPVVCSVCSGHGSIERYPGQRAESDAWERTEPPTGEGWQVWETVSEGSPITPVFGTADALIGYLVTTGAWGKRWSRDAAERFVKSDGWAPTGMVIGGKFHSPENMPTETAP
jgi:hypothetical protein